LCDNAKQTDRFALKFGFNLWGLYLCGITKLHTMSKLVLDLHEIFNKGHLIDKALKDIMTEAVEKKIDQVEIIPGKGSGQLKKKVLRFLETKEIKQLYHRLDKDRDNFGKIHVYLRFK